MKSQVCSVTPALGQGQKNPECCADFDAWHPYLLILWRESTADQSNNYSKADLAEPIKMMRWLTYRTLGEGLLIGQEWLKAFGVGEGEVSLVVCLLQGFSNSGKTIILAISSYLVYPQFPALPKFSHSFVYFSVFNAFTGGLCLERAVLRGIKAYAIKGAQPAPD